jgi:hypothetical protein
MYSRAAVVTERDASMDLITRQLEKDLRDETAATIARVPG